MTSKTLINLLSGAALATVMSAAAPAFAGNINQAIVLPIANAYDFTNGSWTLGFEFSPTANISVFELGDYFPTGSSTTQGVSLWDASGNLLATTTVTGQGALQSDGFDFTAISPVALTAGLDYFVGGTTQTDNYLVGSPAAANIGEDINYIIHAEVPTSGSTPSFPTNTYANFDDFGGNFQYTISTVPEASTWAMMGLGFAGLAFAGYRSRRSVAAIA